MKRLVDDRGEVRLGHFDVPVEHINHTDYALWTPMDRPVGRLRRWLAFNQFEFLGLLSTERVIGVALSNVGYASVGFAYAHDCSAGTHATANRLLPLGWGTKLVQTPEQGVGRFSAPGLSIEVTASGSQRRLQVNSRSLSIDVILSEETRPPLRLCTKAGETGWTFTRKSSGHAVCGHIEVNGTSWDATTMRGLHDWSAGFMRRETFWNWAACSTVLPDGRVLGLNLSCGVNETSFSENAAWLDNTRSPLPQVAFRYNRRDLREPWQISSQCGRVDLVFVPALTAHQENIHAGIVASNFRQIFGHYTGRIALPASDSVMLQDSPGLAERHFARW